MMQRTVARLGTNSTYKSFYEKTRSPLRSLVPESIQDKLRQWFLFRPDDTHDLHQAPPAHFTVPGVDRIKGYRYPAPGTRTAAQVPSVESEDLEYDIKYFSRNTRRSGHLDERGRSTRIDDKYVDGKEIALPDDEDIGSPGTHYTAPVVKEYDPTGLRSAMTATHAETSKAIQTHMPTHNVSFAWEAKAEELVASYESKGLPPVVGMDNDADIIQEAKTAVW